MTRTTTDTLKLMTHDYLICGTEDMRKVEKAHPDVFNVLLQLLDDGRCLYRVTIPLTWKQQVAVSFNSRTLSCSIQVGLKFRSRHMRRGH